MNGRCYRVKVGYRSFRPFIKYCMKRVNMLLKNDVTPIMVFDGSYLPTKANTEKERRE